VDEFRQQCADHIEQKTGFKVDIVVKNHRHLVELLIHYSSSSQPITDLDPLVKQPGNCILASLLHIKAKDPAAILAYLGNEQEPHNVDAKARRSREYAMVQDALGLAFLPTVGIIDLEPGLYIVHCQTSGIPHCVGVLVSENSDHHDVFDVDMHYRLPKAFWLETCYKAVDKSSIVIFKIFSSKEAIVWPEDVPIDALADILTMRAGARSHPSTPGQLLADDFVCDIVGVEHSPDADDDLVPALPCQDAESSVDDESVVHVGDSILRMLQEEVADALRALKKRQKGSACDTSSRCALCPFRVFCGGGHKGRLQTHIQQYHTAGVQYCCSGTKQIKIIASLHDHDVSTGKPKGQYLRRSAEILHSSVKPTPPESVNAIDAHIPLVFTDAGPQF
jgi:hypothetical protein